MWYSGPTMHEVQRALLKLITPHGLGTVTLGEIGRMIGVSHPYKVKHHLEKLEKDGLIEVVREGRRIVGVTPKPAGGPELLSIPVYGAADCGPPTLVAKENFEGFLRVSPSKVGRRAVNDLFALEAVGPSMNLAKTPGGSIEDGDYVIVDGNDRDPAEGSYVVSVIDGCANVKKLLKEEDRVVLVSESESPKKFPPIFIYEDDDFLINGKVIQVIKKPRGGGARDKNKA